MGERVLNCLWCSGLSFSQQSATFVQAIQCFQAKIGLSNESSLRLFGKLGYVETSRSSIFNEATLQLQVSGEVKLYLDKQADTLRLSKYSVP